MKYASRYANLLVYVCVCVCVFVSCRSQQAVQVVPERHDHDSTRILVDHRRDSVYIDRTHSIVQRGDTVFRTDSIYIHEVTEVQVHDTITLATHDSVPVPVKVSGSGASPDDPDGPIPRIYIWSTAILWTLVVVFVLVGVVVFVIRRR